MQNDSKFPLQFQRIKNKKVVANFKGGDITSDGGALLLKKIDKKYKITSRIAKFFKDKRQPSLISHTVLDMLRQRVYGLALGYEDLNDHDKLRKDLALQAAIGKEEDLASSPTLCRFENNFIRESGVKIHQMFLDFFIESFEVPPEKIILDFDSTDSPIYGNQEKKAYHGYYGHDCFLPLHVFCGDKLLVSYLRPSNEDGAKHAWAILALIVKYIRKSWPKVEIVFRADSGFCRDKILMWCEKNKVEYILGIGGNQRIQKAFINVLEEAKKNFKVKNETQKIYDDFIYKAKSWKTERRIIGKAEVNRHRESCRFVITNMTNNSEDIYKNQYCQRGNMENKIQQQFLLFSIRTSCSLWWGNQLRLLLSGIAYVLLEKFQSCYLKKTKYSKAKVDTLRLKLLKISGVIIINTRKIMFYFSQNYLEQKLFTDIVNQINTS